MKLSKEQSTKIQILDNSLVEVVEEKSKQDLMNTILEEIRDNKQSIDEMRKELTKSTEVVSVNLKEEIEALPDKFNKLQSEKNEEPGMPGEQRTYASIVSDTKSLVYPIKTAMKQLKEDDLRARNIVIHGLDINPNTTQDPRQAIKMQVHDILHESTHGTSYEVSVDTESIELLGKVADSGKAPPVLALKEKIRDFPGEHWIIREGKVTSNGKHTPSQTRTIEKDLKSYEY